MNGLLLAVVFCLAPVLDGASVNPEGKELVFAHAIWRHGTRAPQVLYPTSLNTEKDFAPGLGELTTAGMLEQFQLGQRLGQRYIDELQFLSPNYMATEVFVRSTAYNRTIASAMINMAGFYSGRGVPGADFPLNSLGPGNVVVPPHHEPADPALSFAICNREKELLSLIRRTKAYNDYVESFQDLFEYLSKYSGKDVREFKDGANLPIMNPLCDAISVEIEQNKRIADWARKAHKRCVEFLDEMFAQDMGFRTDETIDGIDIRKEGVKTFGGPIMSELVDRFRAKLDNKLNSSQSQWISRKKYYAYSAHDVSLSRLYAALGLDYDRIGRPELADAFLIELWMDKNDKNSTVVKVIHLRKGKEPRDISKEVSGCKDTKEGCSFEEFAARSVFAPSNAEFCDSSLPSQTKIHYKRQFYPDNGLVPRIFDTVYL